MSCCLPTFDFDDSIPPCLTDPKNIAEIMNKHFISAGQTTEQMHLREDSDSSLHQIIKIFEKHNSIISIEKNLKYNIVMNSEKDFDL